MNAYIDPFDVGVPSGSRYPTLTSKYDARGAGSVKVVIEGCHISGFVVGIGISLAGGLDGVNGTSVGMGNGEDISIVDCFIVSTKSAIAVGGTQTRNNSVRNTAVFGTKYAINCTEYGIGSGNCPSIFGANIGGAKYVFTTASWGSTLRSTACTASPRSASGSSAAGPTATSSTPAPSAS